MTKIRRKGRKGQFFIISAVMILLALYSIVNALNSNWQTDVSDIQGNQAPEIFRSLENGINATIHSSDGSNLADNLDSFIQVQKSAIGEAYNLDAFFNITQAYVTANITLSSKTFRAQKSVSFSR